MTGEQETLGPLYRTITGGFHLFYSLPIYHSNETFLTPREAIPQRSLGLSVRLACAQNRKTRTGAASVISLTVVGNNIEAMGNGNSALGEARRAKNDEFYTQYADIEKEMNAYLEYDPDVFRGKTILLPCDDPEWSNFTKYFAQNFGRFGLKKLISTSYALDSKPKDLALQPTLFEMDSPQYDETKAHSRGKIFTLTQDVSGDGNVNVEDLEWDYMEGDGDFRSAEVTELRDQADFVITNPPFSLFREFLAWVIQGDVKFSLIGNMNAITYKEVFPLIKDNRIWLGNGFHAGNAFFAIPTKLKDYAKGVHDEKTGLVKFRNAHWYTNVDHGRRHQPLTLMTEQDNIKFSKHKQVKGVGYQKYDNYDAIEVPFTDAIPSDYPGVMGVPISFLDKYNPEQFEIIGMAKRGAGDPALKTKVYTAQDSPKYSDLNAGPVLSKPTGLTNTYPRILIRHREAVK